MTNQTELERLRARIADVEEELAAWRGMSEVDAETHRLLAYNIRDAFEMPGLQPAKLIATLYHSPRPISYDVLDELMPSTIGDDRKFRTLFNTLACYARRALGQDAIRTLRGWGYELTPAGRALVEAELAAATASEKK